MPDPHPLPMSSDAQNIGARADKCFMARCPENWRPHNVGGTDDFGIDYQVQTLENNQATDVFRVQLKGTTVPVMSADATYFSIDLKASTIRYYARFTEPILLVLCDLSVASLAIDCPLYSVWIHEELRRLNACEMPDEQRSVTLRVPRANILDGQTDLSADLSKFRALASIGAALDMTLETRVPSLSSNARAALLERLPLGFSGRSAALMESLAEQPATVWPDRPVGSMAWLLFEAERYLNNGSFPQAKSMLEAASAKLASSVSLEVAEYWHLTGRSRLADLSSQEACVAFENAIAAEPSHPKYMAAWAETKLCISFSEDGPNDLSDIHTRLDSLAPAVMSIKARILGAEKRFEEAENILAAFSGIEQLSAKAIIHTMQAQAAEVITTCDVGLALPNVKDSTRLLFVILKARAQFNLAVDGKPSAANGEVRVPLAGKPSTNLGLLSMAWDGMILAMDRLRASGWTANTEFVADIFCAAASILDRQEQALSMLSEAAEHREGLATLQSSVESLAAQTGNYELAILANGRQIQSSTAKLRRSSLLHMAKRDAECVAFFESNLHEFDMAHPMFGEALSLALASADRLVRTDLVKAWLKLFDSRPELAPERAVWEYFSTISKNKAKRTQALDALFDSFGKHGKPMTIAVHLLHALNPHDKDEAARIIFAAKVLQVTALFPLDEILLQGQALTTLERWPELLALTQDGQKRYATSQTLAAAQALALDRLGRTAEARALLTPFVAQGVAEPFTLSTHIDIAIRCGFIDEAITGAEAMVSQVFESEKKLNCLRYLHNLVRAKNPSDTRVYDIACRIGELTNPDDEIAEGTFLMMLMMASFPEDTDPAQIAEHQERLKNYTKKFPNSPVLRSATFEDDSTPDEMLVTLMNLVGDTPEKVEARRRKEEQLSKQKTHVPFAWRPVAYVNAARDLPELWEKSKGAKGAEWNLLLSMALAPWEPLPWEGMCDRIPLMDLLALLVAHDLQILDLMFKLFPQVAVSQRTMFELGQLTAPLSGSLFQEKCGAIQATLQSNFGQLLQPTVSSSRSEEQAMEFANIAEEVKTLSRQTPYLLYSDDAYFRIFCKEHDTNFQSVSALDILAAMENQGLLTEPEVANRIGMLCQWGVGIFIQQRWQLASLPDTLRSAQDIGAGVELLRQSPWCIAIFNGLWDRSDVAYAELLVQAAGLLALMLGDEGKTPIAMAALIAIWHEKTIRLCDAPRDDTTALALLVRAAAMSIPNNGYSKSGSIRLWHVYFLLNAYLRKSPMNAKAQVDALSMIACAVASSDLNPANFSRPSLKTFFGLGLADGSNTKRIFNKNFKFWRASTLRELGAVPPAVDLLKQAAYQKPEYWRHWHKTKEVAATDVRSYGILAASIPETPP
jgi:tetratricopeptide (TPR) repeat protein